MPAEFKVKNEGDSKIAEIMIYEPIGDDGWSSYGIGAKAFAEQLKLQGAVDVIRCYVNCPGGDVFDGVAIFNTLKQSGASVEMYIDGLAASAASYIVQAASPGKLFMASNALMMIHCASGGTWGNAVDHDKTSEILRKLDDTIAATYSGRSKRKSDTFLKMMANETWFNATEAVEHKLADKVTPEKKAEACIGLELLAKYKHTPTDVAARIFRNETPEHFIEKCSCGKVLSQCRCLSKDKVERIVENGCADCKQKAATAAAAALEKPAEDPPEFDGVAARADAESRLNRIKADGLVA